MNTEIIGDNDVLNALPTAATQPIANIFQSTTTMDDHLGLTSHGILPAQATPNTNPALGGMQHNPLFPADFQLPASAH